VADCESGDAHAYEHGNGFDALGNLSPDRAAYGWVTERWWSKDTIRWDGGETLLLNNGKLPATIIDHNDKVLRALYADRNNVYAIVYDAELGVAIVSQQQTAVSGKARRLMSRTTSLDCRVRSRN